MSFYDKEVSREAARRKLEEDAKKTQGVGVKSVHLTDSAGVKSALSFYDKQVRREQAAARLVAKKLEEGSKTTQGQGLKNVHLTDSQARQNTLSFYDSEVSREQAAARLVAKKLGVRTTPPAATAAVLATHLEASHTPTQTLARDTTHHMPTGEAVKEAAGVVSKAAASAAHGASVQQTVRRARAVPAAPQSKTDAAAQAAYESAFKVRNGAAANANAQWFAKAAAAHPTAATAATAATHSLAAATSTPPTNSLAAAVAAADAAAAAAAAEATTAGKAPATRKGAAARTTVHAEQAKDMLAKSDAAKTLAAPTLSKRETKAPSAKAPSAKAPSAKAPSAKPSVRDSHSAVTNPTSSSRAPSAKALSVKAPAASASASKLEHAVEAKGVLSKSEAHAMATAALRKHDAAQRASNTRPLVKVKLQQWPYVP